jgi:hypothetical protein
LGHREIDASPAVKGCLGSIAVRSHRHSAEQIPSLEISPQKFPEKVRRSHPGKNPQDLARPT